MFAEVFSGSQPLWPLDIGGWLLIYPLYSLHTIFLFLLALNLKKISLEGLYYMGMIFGLYESWITKVLWGGYFDVGKPLMQPILGIAILEFIVLVLYWHAIMSFIAPLIVYQIFTGRIYTAHRRLITKSRWKTVAIIIYLILLGSLISESLARDQGLILASMTASMGLLLILLKLADGISLEELNVSWKGLKRLGIALLILYIITSLVLRFEAFPNTILPYLTIIAIYILVIYLFRRVGLRDYYMEPIDETVYSRREILILLTLPWISALLYSFIPAISSALVGIAYITLTVMGIPIFIYIVLKTFKQNVREEMD